MDIPNDLYKLLARLQEVTRQTSGTCASGSRPTSAEISLFLSHYDFASDAVIEPIEISKDGVFEFYIFAVRRGGSDDLSLLAMRAEQTLAAEDGQLSESSE
jgi:hypothetical protein